ncbi:hypothetical protein ACFUNF_12755 [Streptomyces sp. NPDC057291]|uniref:hypothetical protein n=1 Tax=Streptomyces sp. NPDC057291 TaxID=3346087 RepID=UPI00363CE559
MADMGEAFARQALDPLLLRRPGRVGRTGVTVEEPPASDTVDLQKLLERQQSSAAGTS